MHVARCLPAGSLLLVLGLLGCGDGDSASPVTLEDDKSASLVGAWHTQGDDPDLGDEVDVRLELMASGSLRVTVTQPGGASLNFPGTWTLTDDVLRLVGVWFQPDGEVEVRCEVGGDRLILYAADGSSQTWERRPSGYTTRTELSPPYGLGLRSWQAGSSRHSPSTTKRYS